MIGRISNLEKYKNLKFRINVVIIASIIITLISEIISKSSIINTFIWVIHNPFYFILNWTIVLSFILLLISISNNRISFGITSTVVIIMSAVNHFKYSIRGIPLIPVDLYLIKEVTSIIKNIYDAKFVLFSIIAALLIGVILLIIRLLPKIEVKLMYRILYAIISITLLFTVIRVEYNNDVQNSGFLFSFITNIRHKEIYEVSNITISDEIKDKLLSDKDNYIETTEKPNIIVIMSEAFWDPKELKKIKFNKNPTENLDRLKKNSIYGYLESPEFGGGTANVEFELLTGHSIHFYNPGYIVYPNEMIKQPYMSLASILKKQGYLTKAIHSYKGWYYERIKVYKNFGFDEFISEEKFNMPTYKGFYISDEYLIDTVIKELEKTTEPTFVFVVTMQNHGPYNDTRYENDGQDIKVLNNNIDSESKQIIETYSQGIYDADKSLGKLIDYCERVKRPTIVLFFGDHLPVLGMDLKAYKEFSYVKENIDSRDYLKLYSVPFILWSNYKRDSKDIGILNVSFMGPYLLKYAGLNMPKYFKFLDGLSKEIPVISRKYAVDKGGNIISNQDAKYKEYNEAYRDLQYNIIYSNGNIIDDYDKWIIK